MCMTVNGVVQELTELVPRLHGHPERPLEVGGNEEGVLRHSIPNLLTPIVKNRGIR